MKNLEVLLRAYHLIVVILDLFLRVEQLLLQVFDYLFKLKFLHKDQLIFVLLTLQLGVETSHGRTRRLGLSLIFDVFSLNFL